MDSGFELRYDYLVATDAVSTASTWGFPHVYYYPGSTSMCCSTHIQNLNHHSMVTKIENKSSQVNSTKLHILLICIQNVSETWPLRWMQNKMPNWLLKPWNPVEPPSTSTSLRTHELLQQESRGTLHLNHGPGWQHHHQIGPPQSTCSIRHLMFLSYRFLIGMR